MIVYDKDAALGANFVHWLLYNIPAQRTSLPEGIPKQADLPDGVQQGRNGYGDIGYVGPCPPGQAVHHYVFNLYALDTSLGLPEASSEDQVTKSLSGHVIAGSQMIVAFGK